MQSAMASEEGCVTITWEIKNVSLLLKEDLFVSLWSPAWKIEKNEGSTWWKLRACNISPYLVFEIEWLKQYSRVDRCEMSFISCCGEVSLKQCCSLDFILQKNALFGENGQSNLPNDTLTLCCKMREGNIKTSEFRLFSVLNSLSYLWNIEDFVSSCLHTFIKQGDFLFKVSLEKKDGQGDSWTVSVREVPCVQGCINSFISFSIKNGSGNVINMRPTNKCYEAIWLCDIQIIPNCRSITLQLESIFACHKVCQEQLALQSPTEIAGHENASGAGSCTLGSDLLRLCRDPPLSDVTLKAEGKSFSAHRSILAAHSTIFHAWFLISGGRPVDIDNVDIETVGRMLVYIYGHSLGDLGWREASALYRAADKYHVVRLKEKCAAILGACLTADNAPAVLVLADRGSDQALVDRVVLFILDHKEVVSSDQWDELERDNSALAAKITRRLFLSSR